MESTEIHSYKCPYCTRVYSDTNCTNPMLKLEDHIEWVHSNAAQQPETD